MPSESSDSPGPALVDLEAQLGSLYTQIAQQHGLAAAMQALGRLMLAPPPPPPPAAPAILPHPPSLNSLPTLTDSVASVLAPVTSITSTADTKGDSPTSASDAQQPPVLQPISLAPFGATTTPSATATSPASQQQPGNPPSPFSGQTRIPSPPPVRRLSGNGGLIATAAAGAAAAAAAAAATASPATSPITIPTFAAPKAPAPALALAHSRTMESVRTLPSPSLSQLPSGVLSIVSPSAADAASDLADGEDGVATPRDAERDGERDGTAAGGASTRVSAGGMVGAPLTGGRLTEASFAAAAAVAAVVAAKAAAVAAEDADGFEVGSVGSALTRGTPRSGSLWMRAVNLSKAVADPWATRKLHTLPMERAVRQRYNAMTGHWVTDEVLIKMEPKPFAAGAMRECYAAKKLSTFTHNVDWHKAQNMVAKRYKKEGVRKSVYYNDVLVQMDAKMLGEMYNKTDPPKQVDVMQCCILHFPGRPGGPVYAVEQLIEGDYVKYNSNSGFVKGDDLLRNTPQAFSHFTWVLTKGLKICVDIQGVGDLYTDPQLHTLDGEGYGEGNLGLRGMGLFFRSHECNALCCRLGLKPFDRCDADVRTQGYTSDTSSASASATRPGSIKGGATAARTVGRTASYKMRLAERRRRAEEQLHAHSSCAEDVQLEALKDVPRENPEAMVHLEIAKLYGETVLLPELKPNEDPEDALRGGLYHLTTSAQCGSLLALMVLARAHCGIEPTCAQFSQLIKVGTRQRQFKAHVAVAWRCTIIAAERGVRTAALAAASAFATGGGLFGEEVLEGNTDAAQAVKWYAAALAMPDLLAEAADDDGVGAGGVIHEGDEEEDEEDPGDENGDAIGSGSGREDDDPTQFEMSVMRDSESPGGKHASAMAELELRPASSLVVTSLESLKVPKLEELKPSRAYLTRLKRAVEEEASALPGASAAKYEVLFQYGNVLLNGGPGLEPSPARAAELLEEAAEEAGAAGKGKLAQKYYEVAARAQALCEEED